MRSRSPRTPKVRDRTAAPALYALLPGAIAAYFAMTAYNHVYDGTWGGFAFSTVSGALTLWGAVTIVGVRETVAYVRLGVVGRLRPLIRTWRMPTVPAAQATAVDGAAFLYYGCWSHRTACTDKRQVAALGGHLSSLHGFFLRTLEASLLSPSRLGPGRLGPNPLGSS